MSDFDYKKHLVTLKGNKEYLPAAARIAWFRTEHPDWGIATEPVIPLENTMLQHKFAIFRAIIMDSNGKIIATATKCETRADFPDFMEKAETGAISRALAYCGYGTLQAMELDEGGNVSDKPEKAPGLPAEAPLGPKPGGKPSGRKENVSGQSPSGKNGVKNMDTVLDEEEQAEREGEDEQADDSHDEDLWAEASQHFREFVFSLGGVKITSDAQEKTLVNRLLKRTGDEANRRPSPQEYMDALKLYERYLKQKAEKDAAEAAKAS